MSWYMEPVVATAVTAAAAADTSQQQQQRIESTIAAADSPELCRCCAASLYLIDGSSNRSSSNSSKSSSNGSSNSNISVIASPAPLGQSIPSGSFSGFSDPPPAASVSAGPPRAPVSLSFTPPTRETDYNSEDLSKYTSPYTESSGVRDAEYASEILSRSGKSPSWLDKHVTNPRLRGCIDGVKMGMKMASI
ncbi:hypothetical protein, conserved [Eimeria brunetti]|uniref:Uncharacterized protein n=1 Tax=Eimeria brunetti TaxID=51314 RepID=U6L677_9EIME|nr:hypothetical protein, conserved [Eimeria brunetti]